MKQLTILSLVIVLFASCAKKELIIIDNENDIETPNILQETDSEPITILNTTVAMSPNLRFFKNEIAVENYTYDIFSEGLLTTLYIKTEIIDDEEVDIYEFHAFDDDEAYFEWNRQRGIYVKGALEITQKLGAYALENHIIAEYEQNNAIPCHFEDYSNKVYREVLREYLGAYSIHIVPSNTTLYKNYRGASTYIPVRYYGNAALSHFWRDNISAFSCNNWAFPTLIFDDIFYQNRLNLAIWNTTDKIIPFSGILKDLNNKAGSWF